MALTALERQQQKAEKLRKQLEKVESSIKRKREQQDEGDEMRDVDGEGADSDASLDSDDEAPEAEPIRSETAASATAAAAAAAAAASAAAAKGAIPPAAKKADPTRHCKYYSTGGTCGKKGKCRFVHDPVVREAALQERERNGGRITLKQRLVLNDKEQEDLTIIKTLQYLKEKGMMTGVSGAPAAAEAGEAAATAPAAVTVSAADSAAEATVVAPSGPAVAPVKQETTGMAGLPAAPSLATKTDATPNSANGAAYAPTVRYQGWDLSGFGNTGVKSEEA